MIQTHIQIESAEVAKYIGFAKQKLAGLARARISAGLPISKHFYKIIGVTIKVISADTGNLIQIAGEGFGGFLFHPRSGEYSHHIYQIYGPFGQLLSINVPYIDGTGWTPEGVPLPRRFSGYDHDHNPLPLESPVYPLFDDDHGTRNIYKPKGKWSYKKNPPENYGNIDWKGHNSASESSPSDAPVLTWRGPRSRYFSKDMYDIVTGEEYYSYYIYKDGTVVGTLPYSEHSYPLAEGPVPFLVLGAAIATDATGDKWKVCVARDFVLGFSEEGDIETFGQYLRVVAQKLKDTTNQWYHKDDHPTGWRILYSDETGEAHHAPFFFNASCTEASAVCEWIIYTVSVNINLLVASIAIEPKVNNIQGSGEKRVLDVQGAWTGTQFFVYDFGPPWDPSNYRVGQEGPGGQLVLGDETYYRITGATISEQISAVCAIDYVGDSKQNAVVRVSLEMEHGAYEQTHMWTSQHMGTGIHPSWRIDYINWDLQAGAKSSTTLNAWIELSGVTSQIGTTNTLNRSGLHNVGSSSYNNNPLGSANNCPDETVGEVDTTLGAVVFMDIRNGIIVVAESTLSQRVMIQTGATHVSGGTVTSLPDVNTEVNEIQKALKLYGEVIDDFQWDDNFVYSDKELEYDYPEYSFFDLDYKAENIFFFYSNQAIGSWAVDRDGNHFYSMLVKDGVYNYLTDGEPVALTKTVGDNPVFYPIAPV
jgi:hypothetical protein